MRAALLAFALAPHLAWAEAQPTVVRVGTVAPEGTPWEVSLTRMRKHIEEESQGAIKLKVFLGGQKGDEKSLVRQCKDGRLEMVGVSTAALATEVPDLEALELPMLFSSSEETDYVLDKHVYAPAQKLLAKNGFVLYQWAENGWQNFGMRDRFIKSPADLAGRKIRSQEARVHIAVWRGFGASPMEMAVSEVLPALKTGLVEGFAQTPLYTFAAGWHQGITHYTVSRHLYQPAAIVYSKKWFDAQPKAVQDLLLAHVEADTAFGRKKVRELEPGLMANFVNYGIKVHELTPAERDGFSAAAAKVRLDFEKTAAPGAKELLKAVDQGKAAYKKTPTASK